MAVSIDRLLSETRLSFTQLAQEQNVATQTVWRWATRGIKGHVLESFNLGAKKRTTREAFSRWEAAINGAPIPRRPNRKSEIRKSKRKLQAAGFKLPA